MTDPLDGLTPAQRDAVRHVEGPLLILAGPGSGKTRVVTHRVAHLLGLGVAARRILALTFTNKAAEEMQRRVQELTGAAPVWMSTFHRFCARLLRNYGALVGLSENFTIYDAYDSRKALARTVEDLDLQSLHYTPEQIATAISRAKNALVTADEYTPQTGHPIDRVVAQVYPAYQQRLLASAAVDFDDLLLHVARLLRENPELRSTLDERYEHILVDEYQDTNRVQYAIVRGLSIDSANLAVTGDPDQSIYGWRGANLNNILEFEEDYPGVRVVRLEQNWRSTKRILSAADRLIGHNVHRKPKALFTENDVGAPVRLTRHLTHREEADSIAARIAEEIKSGRRSGREFAIFYRINALSRLIEEGLRRSAIPYQIVRGLEFYQRKEIKDAVAYLRLVNNPCDDVAFLRIVNTPPRGIGKRTLSALTAHARAHQLPLFETARQCGLIDGLATRAATLVARFVTLIDRLRERAEGSVEELLRMVFEESGYRSVLTESELAEDHERLENLQELLTAAGQFDEEHPHAGKLEAFLEEVALVSETDDWQTENDRVTLMTLHAAKGLEFPVVFIVAAEEGILPHERSSRDAWKLEEERRLLFVGMTRAKQELELSYTANRDFRGQRRASVPSSFLMELPIAELELTGIDAPTADEPLEAREAPAPSYSTAPSRRSAARARSADSPAAPATAAGVTTAAALAGAVSPTAVSPAGPPAENHEFRNEMAVQHPEYGLGKIVGLSGRGPRRTATVAFATSGRRTFVIAKSDLRPARAADGAN